MGTQTANFAELSNDALIAVLDDPEPAAQGPAAAELLHRVEALHNRANYLAYRWLITEDNDAFDGLIACCWKAKGNLFVEGDYVFKPWRDRLERVVALVPECQQTPVQNTRNFIAAEIKKFLEQFRQRTPAEITRLALQRKFGIIPLRVRDRLIDRIRRLSSAAKVREPKPARAKFRPSNCETLIHLVKLHRKTIIRSIGYDAFRTLTALVHHLPMTVPNHRRGLKGAQTQAIQKGLHLHAAMARRRKRILFEALSRQIEPCATQLVTALGITDNDENTVSHKKLRNRS